MNNDNCCLTELEWRIRGIDRGETFFARLVQPVYQLNRTTESNVLYIVTIMLWLVSVVRLISMRREIKQRVVIGYQMLKCIGPRDL